MNLTAAAVAIVIYLVLAWIMGRAAMRGVDTGHRRPALFIAATVAVIIHGVLTAEHMFQAHGVEFTFFKVASLLFWFVTVITLATSLWAPVDKLLVPLYAMSALALALMMAFHVPGYKPDTNISPGVGLHIVVSLLAYSVLGLAALQAMAMALLNRELKARHVRGLINALPPLQTMEQLLFQMVWIGIVLLTMSMITGVVYLQNLFEQHLVHKTVFTIIAWCIFAVLLWGRHRLGWRGEIAVRWTLGGFAALILAYLGSKFVLELILHR